MSHGPTENKDTNRVLNRRVPFSCFFAFHHASPTDLKSQVKNRTANHDLVGRIGVPRTRKANRTSDQLVIPLSCRSSMSRPNSSMRSVLSSRSQSTKVWLRPGIMDGDRFLNQKFSQPVFAVIAAPTASFHGPDRHMCCHVC